MTKDKRIDELRKYVSILLNGGEVSGFYLPLYSRRELSRVLSELMQGRSVSFIDSDLPRLLHKCGFVTKENGIGWEVSL